MLNLYVDWAKKGRDSVAEITLIGRIRTCKTGLQFAIFISPCSDDDVQFDEIPVEIIL